MLEKYYIYLLKLVLWNLHFIARAPLGSSPLNLRTKRYDIFIKKTENKNHISAYFFAYCTDEKELSNSFILINFNNTNYYKENFR